MLYASSRRCGVGGTHVETSALAFTTVLIDKSTISMSMKCVFLAMFALCCVSVASAGSVTQDDYYFSGTESTITLGTDALNKLASGGESFTISYELEGLTFNDLVENPSVFFELELAAVDGSTLEVSMGYNQWYGFYATASPGGIMQFGNSVPYIPESVPFLFQYDTGSKNFSFSYFMSYDSELNPHDLTEILSVNLGADNVFEKGVETGSFTISVPFGTVSEVQTWTGEVTADTIAESKLVPEPTTAALSLLALAGLAARRRRIC